MVEGKEIIISITCKQAHHLCLFTSLIDEESTLSTMKSKQHITDKIPKSYNEAQDVPHLYRRRVPIWYTGGEHISRLVETQQR
jgi:hypothetical protein